MARTTLLGRLTWQVATIATITRESASAVTLALDVPSWGAHQAGQHVDVRLTAPDGYAAQRSYSIASAPGSPGHLEITVQLVADGEVSGWLADIARPGDQLEVRGPIGGYFVWPPSGPEHPVLLVAGGSGIVPLMSMIRARAVTGSRTPFRLIYSVRGPDDVIYADELRLRARDDRGLDIAYAFTRLAPEGWPGEVGRLGAYGLVTSGWPASFTPDAYVCGPTGFVETIGDLLVDAGHDPLQIRTERFGPTS